MASAVAKRSRCRGSAHRPTKAVGRSGRRGHGALAGSFEAETLHRADFPDIGATSECERPPVPGSALLLDATSNDDEALIASGIARYRRCESLGRALASAGRV